ncbi:hypothetical protein AX15_006673 [Amanita polypyramis BW_CC]|nr:hypothetical protein AX15_006673 [Amanita polypyramis BW_CC]
MSSPFSPSVFSSSTLWATRMCSGPVHYLSNPLQASKEWTIAPKPKPGRKPKTDLSSSRDNNDHANKARRIQNRTAQRAFRERKQSQLVELQARIQSYEQGEIERSVVLQNIAKRLKAENDGLRHENQLLREKVARMEGQESIQSRCVRGQPLVPDTRTVGMRVELSADASSTIKPAALYVPSVPSTSSIDSGGISKLTDCPVSYSPDKEDERGFSGKVYTETSDGAVPFSCGFCNEDIPCLCREVTAQDPSDQVADFKGQPSTVYPQSKYVHAPSGETSILDDLPAYQPAVPLPRKRGTPMNPIFPVVRPPSQDLSPANCSGDPSNCLACADDAFGKAFCMAVGESIASQFPCAGCPLRNNAANPGDRCRGDSERGNVTDSPVVDIGSETMPTNEAWKKIKEHPNVSFADLNLLAEVVARRSKCTGPTVVISPAPGEATPERMSTPNVDSQSYSIQDLFLHNDGRTSSSAKERTASLASQQNVVVGCGHNRVSEVYVEGVQDALHLLNEKYT